MTNSIFRDSDNLNIYDRSANSLKQPRKGFEPYRLPSTSSRENSRESRLQNVFSNERDIFTRPLKKEQRSNSPKWERGVSVESDTKGYESFTRRDRKEPEGNVETNIRTAKTSKAALEILLTPEYFKKPKPAVCFFRTSYENEEAWADKCIIFNALQSAKSADMYIEMLRQAPKIQEISFFWEEWQKGKDSFSSKDHDAVTESYLRACARCSRHDLGEKEWKIFGNKENFESKVSLFNAYLKCAKYLPYVQISTGALDRLRAGKEKSEDILSQLQTHFDILVENKEANDKTYQLYLQIAFINGSKNEVERVYSLAVKADKENRIAKMVYINHLVDKREFDKATHLLDQLVQPNLPRSRFEKEEVISLELHDLSHQAGYLLLKNHVNSNTPPKEILVIHGIGRKARNNFAFRDYLQTQTKYDETFANWSWEICLGNSGCSRLINKSESAAIIQKL